MTATQHTTEDQAKALEDALAVVKVQAFQMKRCLVCSIVHPCGRADGLSTFAHSPFMIRNMALG